MRYRLFNFQYQKKELLFLDQEGESFKISSMPKELPLNEKKLMTVGLGLRMFIGFKLCYVGFFVINNELILSIQNRHWRLTEEDVTIRFFRSKYLPINYFQILEGDKMVFKHSYLNHFVSQPLNWLDIICYDPSEDEYDDFFLWVGTVSNDKRWIKSAKEEWVDRLNSYNV